MTIKQEMSESDFLYYMHTIWKLKYFIIAFVAVVLIVTVIIVLKLDNNYQSRALLKESDIGQSDSSLVSSLSGFANMVGVDLGVNGNTSTFDILSSIASDRAFIVSFIKSNHFESKIIPEYDEQKKQKGFAENENMILFREFQKNFYFSKDKKDNIITIGYTNTDRFFAKKMLDLFINDLSIRYRALDLSRLEKQINYYKLEINRTDDISLKNSLAQLIAGYIQKKVLAQSSQYYGFDIIVAPYVPEAMDKVSPRRGVIVSFAFIVSVLISVVGVWLYVNVMRDLKEH